MIKENINRLKIELDKIQENVPEFTDDYHKLFLYFIADQIEGTSPDKLKICEGALDKKVDFYIDEEEKFIVYQCKLPELEIIEKENKIQSYGPDLINELEDALTFFTDEKGTAKGNTCSQESRNKYRSKLEMFSEELSGFRLEVIAAIFGKLTVPAKEELELLKSKWKTEDSKYEIKIVDYDDIVSLFEESLMLKDRPKKLDLPVDNEKQVHTNTWAYTLVSAITCYEAFEKHKMSLFDLNVRYYLEKSHVNKEIIKTLQEEKGQKQFHLLNNGVTIACTGWEFSKSKIILHNPQIINGCQTVISLHRAYTQMGEDRKRKSFKDKCYVPVRIILTQDDILLSEIVTASNNQNKMSPRNLRSNSRFQRLIQRKFNQLPFKWFYDRKDGEFDSLQKHPPSWFKEKDYSGSKNVKRVVSNEDIAKSWLSFIGFSKDASEKINAFDYGFDNTNSKYK